MRVSTHRETTEMTSKPSDRVKVLSALLTSMPGKRGEFLQTLQGLKGEVLLQKGCLDCTVAEDTEIASRFLVFMVWKDLAHLEAYMASDAFRIMLGATRVLTMPAGFRFVTADVAPGLAEPLPLNPAGPSAPCSEAASS